MHKVEWRILFMPTLLPCGHKLNLFFSLWHFNLYAPVTGLASLWRVLKELSMDNINESDIFFYMIPIDVLNKASLCESKRME
jgi:hypothetical protein